MRNGPACAHNARTELPATKQKREAPAIHARYGEAIPQVLDKSSFGRHLPATRERGAALHGRWYRMIWTLERIQWRSLSSNNCSAKTRNCESGSIAFANCSAISQ